MRFEATCLQDPRLPDRPVAIAITSSTPRKGRERTVSLPTVSPIQTEFIADAVETSEASGAQQKKQPFKCESTGPLKAKRTLYMKLDSERTRE